MSQSPKQDSRPKKASGSPRRSRTKAAPAAPAPEATAPPAADAAASGAGGERLHKFLASTGAGSRRECETFIAQGRVSLNGKIVAKMGVKVDPEKDVVLLDGERVRREARVYYLLNKPAGTICTNSDERGRPRAVDLVPESRRIYTVGRLDADSTGLVVLTNDGEIANVVCHPRYRIEKRYQVHVRGDVSRAQVTRVEAGVWLAEGKSSPARVRPVGRNPKRGETILEMTLFEGRNREIRRVFAKVGLTVRRLQRVSIGPLTLESLAPGAWRRLDPQELGFVSEAETLYLANREAWDAELPAEPARPRKKASKHPNRKPMRPSRERRSDARGGHGGGAGWGGGGSFPRRGRRRTTGPSGPQGNDGATHEGGRSFGDRRRRRTPPR